MKYELIFLPAADGDVDEIAQFIALDRVESAVCFYDAVRVSSQEIADFPMAWPCFEAKDPRLKLVRRRNVKGFEKFVIFYRVKGRCVEVFRVIHGSRDLAAVLTNGFEG